MSKGAEKCVCDFQGNPTKIGDCIVYVKKFGSESKLAMGTVAGITSDILKECIVIDGVVPYRITSQDFYRVGE